MNCGNQMFVATFAISLLCVPCAYGAANMSGREQRDLYQNVTIKNCTKDQYRVLVSRILGPNQFELLGDDILNFEPAANDHQKTYKLPVAPLRISLMVPIYFPDEYGHYWGTAEIQPNQLQGLRHIEQRAGDSATGSVAPYIVLCYKNGRELNLALSY